MRGHNIHFHLEIRKIVFELSSIPLLSGVCILRLETVDTVLLYCSMSVAELGVVL